MGLSTFKIAAEKLCLRVASGSGAQEFASKGHGDELLDMAYHKLTEQADVDDSKRVPVQATPVKQNLQLAEREETMAREDTELESAHGIELPVFHRWILENLER